MALPNPKLDDKSFQELLDEAKKLIPFYAPEWTDYNYHDPGITFIELFAWLTEMQIYHLDQINDKNRLKFLKILGEMPRPATAAEADVTFTSESFDMITVPENRKLGAADPLTGETIFFETKKSINILPNTIFISKIFSQDSKDRSDNTQANELEGHFYYAFGENPEIGSEMYIGFENSLPSPPSNKPINIDLMIYIHDSDLNKPGEHGNEVPDLEPSSSLKWEFYNTDGNWTELTITNDETVNLLHSGSISFQGPIKMAQTNLSHSNDISYNKYWIRARIEKGGYEIPPRIEEISLNTVKTIQKEDIKEEDGTDEKLGNGNGLPNQLFNLDKYPVLEGYTQIYTIDNANHKYSWIEVNDFDSSKEEDLHFIINNDKGEILFGNGINGMIPTPEDNIFAVYSRSIDENGNVTADQINLILDDLNSLHVNNKRAATGGLKGETIEDAIIRIKKDIKVPYQAVTSLDYEYLATHTPGLRVARAKAIPDKNNNCVTVLVVPEIPKDTLIKPNATDGFIMTICKHLDKHRLITTQINVKNPVYIEVSISASIKLQPGYDDETMKLKAQEKLTIFLNPLFGGIDGKGWPFGRDVFKSEIYQILDELQGVDCVFDVTLEDGHHINYKDDLPINEDELVYSGKHNITILDPEIECVRGKY